MRANQSEKIYRQPPSRVVASQIAFVIFLLFSLSFAFLARHQLDVELEAIFLVVLTSTGIVLVGGDQIAQVRVTDAGVSAQPFFGRERRMLWEDIRELRLMTLNSPVGSRPGARLIPRRGWRPITISTRLSDYSELLDQLKAHVPRE